MRNDILTLVAATCLAFAFLTLPATADTKGFVFGFDLHSNHVGAEDADPDAPAETVVVQKDGAGMALFAGWGITPSFSLRLNLSGASHETSDPDIDVAYGTVTLEGLYLFRNERTLRPFLLGGLGTFLLQSRRDAFDFQTTGPGIVFGTGVYWFLNGTVALDLGFRADFINWDTVTTTLTLPDESTFSGETPIREDGSAAKVLLGMSFWF